MDDFQILFDRRYIVEHDGEAIESVLTRAYWGYENQQLNLVFAGAWGSYSITSEDLSSGNYKVSEA